MIAEDGALSGSCSNVLNGSKEKMVLFTDTCSEWEQDYTKTKEVLNDPH
jgi:hypothetical protein